MLYSSDDSEYEKFKQDYDVYNIVQLTGKAIGSTDGSDYDSNILLEGPVYCRFHVTHKPQLDQISNGDVVTVRGYAKLETRSGGFYSERDRVKLVLRKCKLISDSNIEEPTSSNEDSLPEP